jgi:signal transduction histidine kinase/ActR/RegA family two-component response regulator
MTIERESRRVLILMPIGRDGPASAEVLRGAGMVPHLCTSLPELVCALTTGAAAAVIAEEALLGQELPALVDWVGKQPAWSDLPIILLTSRHEQPAVAAWRHGLVRGLRNASLLERPVQTITLVSAVQAALRARLRQYEVRSLIEAQTQAAEYLEAMVIDRTQELQNKNEELRRQMEERERIEEALRQVQKMDAVGRLSGGIAHDFNNLLQSMAGNFELIRGAPADTERVRRRAEAGLQSAERGAKLTGQLLAFSRAQRLETKPLIVSELIFGLRDLLSRTLGPMIDIGFDLDSDRVPILSDPIQLEMAVLNLAINARDAMPDGGKLMIATRAVDIVADPELPPGKYVKLSVTDTGIGMPSDVAARAFDPFYTTKGPGRGTGLGLSQVYGIARQAGGTARIETAPGRGTTVHIWLQRTDLLPDAATPPTPSERKQSTPPATVLVIDDDADVRRMLVESLEALGYRVNQAEDGRTGLSILEGAAPDVVVIDFAMPRLNGAEVAKAARARLPKLPIIFATGYADTAAIEEMVGPHTPVLRKPFRMNELQAAVAEAIQKAHASSH